MIISERQVLCPPKAKGGTRLTENLTDYLVSVFSGTLPKELIIFIISLFPILEVRGGMIAAKLLGVSLGKAFAICYLGNIIPIPFILLFIRRILEFFKKYRLTSGLAEKLEARSAKKSDKVIKYKWLGLLLFVAIPLPGTGGWTGALVAALMDLRIKHSFPIIALGVLIADFIMAVISYGLLGIFVK